MKSNYYYNCGSIPKAGQIRAVNAMKRWMDYRRPIKYAASLDVHHFFDTCKAEVVMAALSRKFKDKRFLALNRLILQSMGDTLAIGFDVSHWYAN